MNNKTLLKKEIYQTELKIKRLKAQSNKTQICEDLYNSLIIKKAVLKKQLEEANKNPVIEKIMKLFPRRKKLISDYFS